MTIALPQIARMQTWLVSQAPKAVDQAAVSQALSHGVKLDVQYKMTFPKDPETGESLGVYEVVSNVEATGGNAAAALADIEKLMVPAPTAQLERLIAELSVITAKRQDDEFTEALRVTAYARRLADYPADVVTDVLTNWRGKFFPTFEELRRVCDAKTGPRRAMINALRFKHKPAEEARELPSMERRRELAAQAEQMLRGLGASMTSKPEGEV